MELSTAVLVVALMAVVIAVRRKRRRRSAALDDVPAPDAPAAEPVPSRRMFGIGPGAAGTIYELLNEERRHAIEIIVEDKAAYRDPEDADGNLPDLEER